MKIHSIAVAVLSVSALAFTTGTAAAYAGDDVSPTSMARPPKFKDKNGGGGDPAPVNRPPKFKDKNGGGGDPAP